MVVVVIVIIARLIWDMPVSADVSRRRRRSLPTIPRPTSTLRPVDWTLGRSALFGEVTYEKIKSHWQTTDGRGRARLLQVAVGVLHRRFEGLHHRVLYGGTGHISPNCLTFVRCHMTFLGLILHAQALKCQAVWEDPVRSGRSNRWRS